MKPKNQREKVLHRLNQTYEWEKVWDLNIAQINEDNYIPLLHDIDGDKMNTFIKKMDQEHKLREKQKKQEISTTEFKLVVPDEKETTK